MAGVQIQKPRAFQSMKDITLTLGVLLVAVFLTVGFTGMCSFNPGRPDTSGPVREIDAETILKMDAMGLGIPIRYPEMPENWVSNSARRVQIGQEPSSLVGWVIDGGEYVSLTQTAADMKAATQPDDDVREAAGTRNIGETKWQVFEGEDARPIWVADLGDVRLILESMTSEENLELLARRVVATKPFESNRLGQPSESN